MSPFQTLVQGFPDHRVLVLGDVMLDEYLTGDCSRISPEAPVPVLAVRSARTVLGGAANTAANISALGGHVVLVGLTGRDGVGRQLAEQAAASGIEFVPVLDDRPTVRKVRVLGQQQQLLRLDYEATSAVPGGTEDRILAAAREQFTRCSVVVISDYAKGVITERVCQRLIADAHGAGKEVIVDPRPQHASYYRGCDYLTPNWKESLGLLNHPEVGATPEAIEATGRLLVGRFRSHVLMTLGPVGMRFFHRDGTEEFGMPTVAKEVFDVSGAGDTVVATFALARAAGCDHRTAVGLANRAAGLVVAKLGTATITPAELLREEDDEPRVVSRGELSALSATLRAARRRIVTINGSFDVMHAGHLHILREARRQGDVLIVGLNTDRSVREHKGPGRPFVGQADRARMLLALRDVDYVHLFDEAVPMPFLAELRPDVHVNGSEYGEDCIEAETVRAGGGRVHVVGRIPGLSTSELVERIASGQPGKVPGA
jgi:D-beta-D-heptose 7-phosphate kinase/D-beta-D-heptose 1-phosphate adenosyltransferase